MHIDKRLFCYQASLLKPFKASLDYRESPFKCPIISKPLFPFFNIVIQTHILHSLNLFVKISKTGQCKINILLINIFKFLILFISHILILILNLHQNKDLKFGFLKYFFIKLDFNFLYFYKIKYRL